MMALTSGGCTIDALTWAGEHQDGGRPDHPVDRVHEPGLERLLPRRHLAVGAGSGRAGRPGGADPAAGGDPAAGPRARARHSWTGWSETARRGRPRGGRLGPEGRGWVARAPRRVQPADRRARPRPVAGGGDRVRVRLPVRGGSLPVAVGGGAGRPRRPGGRIDRGGRGVARGARDGCPTPGRGAGGTRSPGPAGPARGLRRRPGEACSPAGRRRYCAWSPPA